MNHLRGVLLSLLFCSSIAIACHSSKPAESASSSVAVELAGFELAYRKPTGDPFTSAEVEQITNVLRQRVHGTQPTWGVSAMVGADHLLHVELPDAPNADAVDALRSKLELPGQLAFEAVANESTQGWDAQAERARLSSWWGAQKTPSLEQYDALSRDQGGPPAFVRWRELKSTGALSTEQRLASFLPCIRSEVLHADRSWQFGSNDLGKLERTTDPTGFPAISFEMSEARKQAFGEFTGAYAGHQIAIVLDGVVISAPLVREALLGAAVIEGRFEQGEVDDLVAALRSGPLPTRLEFVALRPRAER